MTIVGELAKDEEDAMMKSMRLEVLVKVNYFLQKLNASCYARVRECFGEYE